MSEEVFSSDMPELQSLIKKLDVFDEETNKAVRTAMHSGADVIMREQKRLISGKSERLAAAISKSKVYATKKGGIGVSTGYQGGAFKTNGDGFNPGIVGMVFEFGRPGSSSAKRSSDKMKQVRKRIPNKKTAKRSKWEKAVPTEVDISKGTIQAVPHIRRGFDIKKEEAVNIVLDAVNREIDKL